MEKEFYVLKNCYVRGETGELKTQFTIQKIEDNIVYLRSVPRRCFYGMTSKIYRKVSEKNFERMYEKVVEK